MNPLMSEMANKAHHDDLLREAKRIRAEQMIARRTAERSELPAKKRRIGFDRALALLTSIITPW